MRGVGGEALALVLAAAVLHALWNLAAKGVTEDRLLFIWMYASLSAAIWLPIAVVWVVVYDERPTWTWLGAAALSAAMHIAYQLVLQRGYAEGDLNLVYPIARGTGPLLTFVVAVAAARRAARRRRRASACCWWSSGCCSSRTRRAARCTDPERAAGVLLGCRDRRDHRGVHALGQPLPSPTSACRR